MRPFSSAPILLFGFYCASSFAQSGTTTVLLNRIDHVDGAIYSQAQSAPLIGDFNNDGNTDFLTITSTLSGLPVLQTALGRGDGTILALAKTPLVKTMTFGISGQTSMLGAAVADFNGDRKQDVVFLTTLNGASSPSYLSYFAGNGDGTFSVPTNVALPTGEIPVEIVPADFNHDGKPDVAVLCQGGDILVYPGKGDGTLQSPIISSTGAPQNSGWTHFLVGDVNKDGSPDLLLYAVNNYVTYSTSIMLGNGDGSFKSAVVIPQLSNLQTNQQLILADLNGDGSLDILADLNNGSQIMFLPGDGKGGFANPVVSVTLPSGFDDQSEWSAPALIDLDGDGKLDIVFSYAAYTQGMTEWSRGNGDGTFQTPTVLTSENLWGVYAVSLSAKTTGLFSPQVQSQDASNQATSVVYLPTKLSQAIGVSHALIDLGLVNLGTGVSGGQSCEYDETNYNCPPDIQITNRGTVSLNLSSIATQTPFTQLNNCPTTLSIGQSCQISAEFVAQQAGVQNGALAINNGTSINPLQVLLTAIGTTPTFSLEPTSLTFSGQKVNTISNPQTFTLTNLTGTAQRINIFQVVSQYSKYFVENDDCGDAITTSCTISIQFAPLSPGAITANLEVWDSNGNLTVGTISGTAYSAGPAVSVSPSSLDFGKPFAGTSVAPQSVTLSNTGDAPVLLSSVTAGTGFTALNACGSSIQPGASCAVGVFVDTSTTGTKTGSLTITDNAPNSPQTISLSGNVQSLSVAAASGSSTSATLTAGGTANYSLTVTPVSGFSGTIAVGCKNVPAGFSCTPSSISLVSDGKNPLSVTLAVKATSTAAVERSVSPLGALPVVLSFSAMIFLFPRFKRDSIRLLLITVALVLPLAIGCGSSSSDKSTPPVTPTSQNYTLTATFGTANGGSVQVPLKLTVQN